MREAFANMAVLGQDGAEMEMAFREIGILGQRAAIAGDGLFHLALPQQGGAQIVQQYRVGGTRGERMAIRNDRGLPNLRFKRIEMRIRQAKLRRLPHNRARFSRLTRRKQALGQRKIIKRLCRIGSQGRFQQGDAFRHASRLDQKHAQVMIGAGMARVGADQGTVFFFCRRQMPRAMIRKRPSERGITGWRSFDVGHAVATIAISRREAQSTVDPPPLEGVRWDDCGGKP